MTGRKAYEEAKEAEADIREELLDIDEQLGAIRDKIEDVLSQSSKEQAVHMIAQEGLYKREEALALRAIELDTKWQVAKIKTVDLRRQYLRECGLQIGKEDGREG
jgi:hypothetical protein